MFKRIHFFIICVSFLVISCAHGESVNNSRIVSKAIQKQIVKNPNIKAEHPIQGVFERYNKTTGLKLDLIKKVKSGLLGKETTSTGKLSFSNGNLRLDFSKPDKSLLLVNKNNITFAQKLDKEFGGHWQVYKAKKNRVIKSQVLVGVIFGDNKIWSQLKEAGKVKLQDKIFYFFEPKVNSKIKNIKKIGVVLTQDKKDILLFKYWDHVENETTYMFKNIKKGVKLKKNIFKFKIPKNSELIYL